MTIKEYRIQGRGAIPGISGWIELGRAAGMDIPWITTETKAREVLAEINERKTGDAEYRIVTREVTEWQEVSA